MINDYSDDGNSRFVGHEMLHSVFFFFSSRRRHTRFDCDWSSDVCSSDLMTTLDNIFKQAASQGQSFYSASGDNGAYDCGDSRLTVDSPANDPYMTGTGGKIGRASCRERV